MCPDGRRSGYCDRRVSVSSTQPQPIYQLRAARPAGQRSLAARASGRRPSAAFPPSSWQCWLEGETCHPPATSSLPGALSRRRWWACHCPTRPSPPRWSFRFWLDVAAEAEAHGRQHLLAKGMGLARAEPSEERCREHVGGDGFLDGGVNGPATFTGIFDVTRKRFELFVLGQCVGGEIKQPGRDDTAAPPDFGDIAHVEIVALIRRQFG